LAGERKNREKGLNKPGANQAALFGAALDFLDDPERLALKQAYLEARTKGSLRKHLPADPYRPSLPCWKSG